MNDAYRDAQMAIIGCLLINSKLCSAEIFDKLRPEHFTLPEYQTLFIKARELYEAREPIDRIMMIHKADSYRSIIIELLEVTPTAQNYREYIEVMLEEYKRYRAQELLRDANESALNGDLPALRELSADIVSLIDGGENEKASSLAELFGEFCDEMDRKPQYIRFGFKDLDSKLFVEKGDYVVIGARPSVGKTALALNCAGICAREYKTIFFSLETDKAKLAARYFSSSLGIDFSKIKNRALDDDEKGAMAESYLTVARNKLYFKNASGKTAQEICAAALREQAEIIFIDYLGLVESESRSLSTYEKVSAISKYFHTFAQKHKVLVVLLVQLNREAAGKESPTLAHLRDSGQIEQDADVIILMHKPKKNDNMRELIVAKNKEGETGSVPLDFDGKHQKFFESKRSSDIFREIRKLSKKDKDEAAVLRVFGTTFTEVTDQDELAAAQQALPM